MKVVMKAGFLEDFKGWTLSVSMLDQQSFFLLKLELGMNIQLSANLLAPLGICYILVIISYLPWCNQKMLLILFQGLVLMYNPLKLHYPIIWTLEVILVYMHSGVGKIISPPSFIFDCVASEFDDCCQKLLETIHKGWLQMSTCILEQTLAFWPSSPVKCLGFLAQI